jgi:hypothetical protein
MTKHHHYDNKISVRAKLHRWGKIVIEFNRANPTKLDATFAKRSAYDDSEAVLKRRLVFLPAYAGAHVFGG